MWILTFFKQIRDSLTPNTPSPLFPLSKLESGTGGEVVVVRQRKEEK